MSQVRVGEIVLDAAAGTGERAVAAARAVGPGGRVIGLETDLVKLAAARALAAEAGLGNVEFRQAAFEQAYFRSGSFDVVICPDDEASRQKASRLLRSGGRMVLL